MTICRVLLCCLLLLSTVAAQQERRQGGPPPYDPASEVTVAGTVIALETITPPDRPEQAVLMITVNNVPRGVFMGPSAWLTKQGMTFTKGASVTVVGMEGFKYNGNAAMSPRTVKVGTRTLTLRDEKGLPVWESGDGKR